MRPIKDELKGMTVLLVDDESVTRRWLEAQIRGLGVNVIQAENGAMAIALIEAKAPDLVLLDAVMPLMDGFETCLRIKGNPLCQNIPVIILTALKGDAKDRAYESGADDFLNKPPHAEELRSRVLNHLRIAVLRRRQRKAEAEFVPLEALGKPRILLAMEDPTERQAIAEPLKKRGMDVRTLGSFKSVMTFLGHENPDLLILSSHLPDGNSQTFCARLRNFEVTRELPVMLVVDEHDLDSPLRSFDVGLCDLLVKPFEPQELEVRTQSLLRQGHLAHAMSPHDPQAGYSVLLDPRTGLPGRPFFEAHLEALCGISQTLNLPLSLGWLRFKQETRWGQEGQRVLSELARLKSPLQGGDTLCRLGQDLFVYLFPGLVPAKAKDRLEDLASEFETGLVDAQGCTFPEVLHRLATSLGKG